MLPLVQVITASNKVRSWVKMDPHILGNKRHLIKIVKKISQLLVNITMKAPSLGFRTRSHASISRNSRVNGNLVLVSMIFNSKLHKTGNEGLVWIWK